MFFLVLEQGQGRWIERIWAGLICEPIATVPAFHSNGNGRIDLADVVWLFNNL